MREPKCRGPPTATPSPVQRIEQHARDERQLVVRHHLDDGGNRLAGERVAMPLRPRRRSGSEQHGFHARNRQRVQVGVESTIARPFERGGHAVVDEHRASDVTDRGREQDTPRVLTHTVIGGPTHHQIALFERVGEREDSAKFLTIHTESVEYRCGVEDMRQGHLGARKRSPIMHTIRMLVVGIALAIAISGCAQPPTGVAAAAEAMGATQLNSIQYSGSGSTFAFGQAASPGRALAALRGEDLRRRRRLSDAGDAAGHRARPRGAPAARRRRPAVRGRPADDPGRQRHICLDRRAAPSRRRIRAPSASACASCGSRRMA